MLAEDFLNQAPVLTDGEKRKKAEEEAVKSSTSTDLAPSSPSRFAIDPSTGKPTPIKESGAPTANPVDAAANFLDTPNSSWLDRKVAAQGAAQRRQRGLGWRATIEGTVSAYSLPFDALIEIQNMVGRASDALWGRKEPLIPEIPTVTGGVSQFLTSMGMPVEETAAERIRGMGIRVAAGTIATAGTAGLIRAGVDQGTRALQSTYPLLKSWASDMVDTFAATPVRQVISGFLSGVGGEVAAEAVPKSPYVQAFARTAGSTLGAMAPGVVPSRTMEVLANSKVGQAVLRTEPLEKVNGISAQPYENAFPVRKAAAELGRMRATGPMADTVAANSAETTSLEDAITGLKYNLADRTGDPNLVAWLQQQKTDKATTAKALDNMQGTAAIGSYIAEKIKGGGNSASLTKRVAEVQTDIQAARALAVEQAQQMVKGETSGLPLDSLGEKQRNLLVDERQAARNIMDLRIEHLNKDLTLKASPLEDSIKAVWGGIEPFFTDMERVPNNILTRTMKGIIKEEPASIVLNLKEEPAIPASRKVEINLGQIIELNKHVNSDMRQARRAGFTGEGDLVDKLYLLKKGINQTVDDAITSGGLEGRGAAEVRGWWDDYKNDYVPKYQNKTALKVLSRGGADMEYKLPAAKVGKAYFLPGVDSFQGIKDFNATFGDNPAALDLVHQYAAEDLSRTLDRVSEGKGFDTPRIIDGWKRRNADALKGYGLENAFDDVTEAIQSAGEAKARRDAMNKTVFSRLVGAPAETVMQMILDSGNVNKNLDDLFTQIVKTPEGVSGAKAAVGDIFKAELERSKTKLPNGDVLFDAERAETFIDTYRPALQRLYPGEGEMTGFNFATAAVKKLNIDLKAAGATSMVPMKSLTQKVVDGFLSTAPLNLRLRVTKTLSKITYPLYREIIDDAILGVVYSPEKANQIYGLAQELKNSNRPPAKVIEDFTKRQLAYQLGMQSYNKKKKKNPAELDTGGQTQ